MCVCVSVCVCVCVMYVCIYKSALYMLSEGNFFDKSRRHSHKLGYFILSTRFRVCFCQQHCGHCGMSEVIYEAFCSYFPEHCSDTLLIITARLHDQCSQRLPLCQSGFAVVFYERKHLLCSILCYLMTFVRHFCWPHLLLFIQFKFSFFACSSHIFTPCVGCFFSELFCAH